MLIRVKKDWRDYVEGPKHKGFTRRDFLARGLATGMVSVALPRLFGEEFLKAAQAGTLTCPPATKNPGAIAQVFSEGGPTMGARFISEAQASGMGATMASNYGITGTNFMKLGPGLVIDSTSVFGQTLLQGPPGFPGGAAAWKTTVLSKLSAGGHLGPFSLDDGPGFASGLFGSVSLDRSSQIGKDIWINPGAARPSWTSGTPAAFVKDASLASLQSPFTLIPTATGNTSNKEMTNASNGAYALAQAMAPVFKTDMRDGSNQMMTKAGCAFLGNSALTDSTFAPSLFDPNNITPLTSKVTVSSLTAQEQTLLTSFYQSASGVVGGVVATLSGRDYHGADPQTVIAPADIEDARSLVMFLAACYAAQQPGALIYVSNGQCIATGTKPVTATVNGSSLTMNCPVGVGDAGGFYNAGMVVFYSPSGSVPTPRYTGTLTSTGQAIMDPNVGSYANALAGLYLSAHQFVSGSMPASLLNRLKTASLVPAPSKVMVI